MGREHTSIVLIKGIQTKFPNGLLKNYTKEEKCSNIKMPALGRGGLLANDKKNPEGMYFSNAIRYISVGRHEKILLKQR